MMSILTSYIATVRIFVLILLLALHSLSERNALKAQDFQDPFKYQIGAAAGMSTGYGLSFRYWPQKWGLQTTFGPYYDSYGPSISIGVSALRLIEDNGWSRFFLYAGNHIHIDEVDNYDYITGQSDPELVTTYVLGFGPGLEFLVKRRLGINVMFGIAAYMDTSDMFMTHLTGETGVFYRF